MKRRLGEAPLPAPELAFARYESVADETVKERRAKRLRFPITARVRRQERFDIARVVKKVGVNVEKPCMDHIAIITTTFDKPERVAIKLTHHAHNQLALRSRRHSLRHLCSISTSIQTTVRDDCIRIALPHGFAVGCAAGFAPPEEVIFFRSTAGRSPAAHQAAEPYSCSCGAKLINTGLSGGTAMGSRLFRLRFHHAAADAFGGTRD